MDRPGKTKTHFKDVIDKESTHQRESEPTQEPHQYGRLPIVQNVRPRSRIVHITPI
jgi:hypothetical protein